MSQTMLTHEALRSVLDELKHGLQALYGERLKGMYLFGSYARDEAEPESDIDVLVVLDRIDDYWVEIQRASELSARLSLDCGATIAKVFLCEQDWRSGDSPFLHNVSREAVAA